MKEHVTHLIGDATDPFGSPCWGPSVIAHVCNDIGKMASGFVVPLCERYPRVKTQYEKWYKTDNALEAGPFKLGRVQFVLCSDGRVPVYVANMIAQHETIRTNPKPIGYVALKKCLDRVFKFAYEKKLVVRMPRIGAGRSKGDWSIIEGMIEEAATVPTYIYTLEKEKHLWAAKTQPGISDILMCQNLNEKADQVREVTGLEESLLDALKSFFIYTSAEAREDVLSRLSPESRGVIEKNMGNLNGWSILGLTQG